MAEKDISTYTVLDPAAGDVALGTRGEAEGSITYRFRLDALIPPGMILPYGGSSAPSGWLSCDGSAVSRATYSDLFDAIGTAWGVGDGSTTFNVPDLRETVTVGTGTRGSGVTAHDTYDVGEFKDDQMQQITGQTTGAYTRESTFTSSGAFEGSTLTGSNNPDESVGIGARMNANFDSADSPDARTGTVTRGKQAGVLYCIKA